MLGPAFAHADGDQRAVARRVVPVDRRRRVGAGRRRIEKHDGLVGGIGRRPPGEHELLGARRALVAEQPVAAQRCVLQHGQLDQPTSRSCQTAAGGTSRIDLVSSFWAATQAATSDRRRPRASGTGRRRRCRDRCRRRPHAGSAGPRSTTSCGRTDGGLDQPRPMLGRLPWFALERRMRALRFLVFFDIGRQSLRASPEFGLDRRDTAGSSARPSARSG